MSRLAKNLRQLQAAAARLTAGRRSPLAAFALDLPRVVVGRAHRALAPKLNGAWPLRAVNRRRLARFDAQGEHAGGGHFYVIVMPGTLHFVLPCLRLLPADLPVHLVANGARAWERRHLAAAFPARRMCTLATLPASSLAHGDVVTLLLERNAAPFSLLDHDCYVFDAGCFRNIAPAQRDCATAWFGGVGRRAGLPYPDTFFVVLHAPLLRDIMRRHRVDARIYRTAPSHVRAKLARTGLRDGVVLKDHHDFFDTLHLLVALALAEGCDVRFAQAPDEAIVHVGGTSFGVPETKDLLDRYMQLRFLELADDPLLRKRYRRWLRPFASADVVRARIPMTPAAFARIAAVDRIVERLRAC